jgi:hypothetical protein|tara:strand:- start:955 stop:2298 length:1344 start_codon:yes stop_codon:yes gene_type:complete
MSFLTIVLFFLVGLSFIYLIDKRLDLLLLFGLSFPVGVAVTSAVLFFNNTVLNISLQPFSFFITTIILTILFLGIAIKKQGMPHISKEDFNVPSFNLGVIFFFTVIAYVFYWLFQKAVFWPTTAYDSIAGYHFLAKAIALEGVFNNSIFEIEHDFAGRRFLYPPMMPIAFSIAYIFEYSPKVFTMLFYGCTLISFFAFTRKHTGAFGAALFTFFLAIIPEYAAMATLTLTNVPQVLFTMAGIILLFEWLNNQEISKFYLASFLISMGIWLRTEGIIFAAAGFIFILFDFIKNKNFKPAIIYSILIIIPFLSWELYVEYALSLSDKKQPFQYALFWDYNKISMILSKVYKITLSTQYYGYTVIIFFIGVLINVKTKIYSQKELLLTIIGAWVLYLIIFYQIDNFNEGKLVGNYIRAGYKRALFNFFPLMLYYVATVEPINSFFKKYLS